MLVKAVYQWQIADSLEQELLSQYESLEDFAKIDQSYFRSVLSALMAAPRQFDLLIAKYSERGIEPLDYVGRAVLLVALTELRHCEQVPRNVVINEAINLAKRYAAADSYRFINAILDKAAEELRAGASP